jgi:hypothetical protein
MRTFCELSCVGFSSGCLIGMLCDSCLQGQPLAPSPAAYCAEHSRALAPFLTNTNSGHVSMQACGSRATQTALSARTVSCNGFHAASAVWHPEWPLVQPAAALRRSNQP